MHRLETLAHLYLFAAKGNLEKHQENKRKQTESIILHSGETNRQERTSACHQTHP